MASHQYTNQEIFATHFTLLLRVLRKLQQLNSVLFYFFISENSETLFLLVKIVCDVNENVSYCYSKLVWHCYDFNSF